MEIQIYQPRYIILEKRLINVILEIQILFVMNQIPVKILLFKIHHVSTIMIPIMYTKNAMQHQKVKVSVVKNYG